MQFIGRIITKSKNKNIDTISDYVEVTSDIEKIDDVTPTLIIGKSLAESIYGEDNVKVLERQIKDNVWWTFSKLDLRTRYEDDLKEFNKLVVDRLIKSIEYKCINIFTLGYNEIKHYYAWINNQHPKIVYVYKNHIYIYDRKKVLGISLTEIEYFGISKKHIFKVLLQNSKNEVIYNDNFLSSDIKKHVDYSKILIPYLYFLAKF